jgi:hypothetical protein
MWIIGIVALSQVVCLPGAVLFRLFRISGGNAFERVAGVFASSLIANCALVTLLVSARLQRPGVWWAIIAAEILYLLATWRRKGERWRFELRWLEAMRTMSAETALAGILLVAVLGIFSALAVKNWGSVYVGNDDVARWDPWAVEWSRNMFPTRTDLYPQLLPTNASISYVLLGVPDIKMFAKATAPLYSVLIIFLFLSMAIRRRDPSYLWGGATFGFLVIHYMGIIFPTYGYADLPLAFFGFLTWYCVCRSDGTPSRDAVFAGLIASLGALLTKQGGVFIVVAMALYAVYWRRQSKKECGASGAETPRFLRRDAQTFLLAFFVLLTAIWFSGKFIEIFQGREVWNFRLLTQGLHKGRSYWQRLAAAWQMFYSFRAYTGPIVTVATAGLILASLFIRRTRAVTAFVLLPFLLLYGLYFSYEIRNGLAAFPIIALVCGVMIHQLAGLVPQPAFMRRPWIGVAAASLVTAVLAGWLLSVNPAAGGLPPMAMRLFADPWITDAIHLFVLPALIISLLLVVVTGVALTTAMSARIRSGAVEVGRLIALAATVCLVWGAATTSRASMMAAQTQEARLTIGDPAVNEALYNLIAQRHITSGIVTDYWFLRALPDIKGLFRATGCGSPCNIDSLRASVEAWPDAGFILMADRNLAPEAKRLARKGGEFTTLFLINGIRFIQVNPNFTPPAPGQPALVSILPATGAGAKQEFVLTFRDGAGAQDISDVILIVNKTWQPAKACYVQWYRNNNLTIANDNGVGWADEKSAGSAGEIANSQCAVDVSRVVASAQGDMLKLRIPIRFTAAFSGTRHFYASAVSNAIASPYRDGATWQVPR